jgi:hypothetical protein
MRSNVGQAKPQGERDSYRAEDRSRRLYAGGRSHAQFRRRTKARKKKVPNQQTAANNRSNRCPRLEIIDPVRSSLLIKEMFDAGVAFPSWDSIDKRKNGMSAVPQKPTPGDRRPRRAGLADVGLSRRAFG